MNNLGRLMVVLVGGYVLGVYALPDLATRPARANCDVRKYSMTDAKSCPDGTKSASGKSDDDHNAVWCEKPDGLRHGHYIEFWPGGKKKLEGEYNNGQRQGLWTGWYDTGQKQSICSYQDGKSHGHSVVYYSNGNKQEEGDYREDQQDGPWITWYENGQKKTAVHFIDNKPVGRTVSWYDTGQKKSEQEYNLQHKETGHWIYYFKSGKIQGKGDYRNGEMDGTWREWDEDGKILREKTYRYGDVVSANSTQSAGDC